MQIINSDFIDHIDIKLIVLSDFSVRDKFQENKDIDDLIISIKEHGLLHPVLVRAVSNKFEIIAGHRRYFACKSLRWRSIPCRILEITNKELFELQLVENIQRKSMDHLEEAEAFIKYVMDYGWGGISDLAKKIGKSEEYISHKIGLLDLPQDIKEQINKKKITVSQAQEFISMSDVHQSLLIKEIINNNLTVRQIREIKALLSQKTIEDNENDKSFPIKRSIHVVKVTKKVSLALKVTLTKIDSLIEDIERNTEPDLRKDLVNFLMSLRIQIHSLIDDTIKFKNDTIKKK